MCILIRPYRRIVTGHFQEEKYLGFVCNGTKTALEIFSKTNPLNLPC